MSQKLGDYLILDRIAHGGMAQIYKAKTTDPNGIERLVVIKRILPHISSNPEYVEMLIDEAKIAVNFTHGNIAQVYDLGKVGDDYFIVMEYVDGKTLSQILREFKQQGQSLPTDLVLYCLSEVCQGLDYIHNKTDAQGKSLGVVHRDVSPQNIIVSYSGTVKIIDFGVAKALDKLSQTESGVLKGKYAYMSPEQADGDTIDWRSDLFSVGVLLWELLTQERLFKKKTNQETLKAVRKAIHPKLAAYRSNLPKDIEKIASRALAKKKKKRYQSASDLAEDLKRLLMQIRPDFRPVDVSRFLFENFGPEPDEKDMTPEVGRLVLPKKIKSSSQSFSDSSESSSLSEEETTTELETIKERFKFSFKKMALLVLVILFLMAIGFWFYNKEEAKQAEPLPDNQAQADEPVVEKAKQPKPEPQPEPMAYSDLLIESEPSGATVYLDNMEWMQKTPIQIGQLKQGHRYKIGVFLDGYQFEEQTITLDDQSNPKLKFLLSLDYASFEITTEPSGADVIIDGQVLGKTPYVIENIKPSESLEFELYLKNYSKYISNSVDFKAGEKRELHYNFKTR